MIKVAFTGTRQGLTSAQKEALTSVIRRIQPKLVFHGACHGADREFHEICKGLNKELFPSNNEQLEWANSISNESEQIYTVIHPVMEPLKRNKLMVNLGDMLIACPSSFNEIKRSGTWATIRYSERISKHITYIWPNGEVTTKRD